MKHPSFVTQLRQRALSATVLLISLLTFQQSAHAFCGFYVAGSNDDLYADATQVALMRGGTTTVLSMENNYRGPLADFAMVVPVPEVLMQDQVKTLEPALFRRLDKLTAPRLVQYWEKDPCEDNVVYVEENERGGFCDSASNNATTNAMVSNNFASANNAVNNQVVVEAQFAVGEYEIVILSSEEATSLESWLTTNNYNIPAGATEIFEQYIQQGMYFFVAKIDPAKVTFEDGQAILSPLRFHYTSETFSLPIRLGMINSAGSQDLIVYTIGGNQRYELGNYPNALIPTNINVKAQVKEDFPAYYEKLFSRTLAENPSAVITEYAWSASGCDPCPVPPMDGQDLATLGADVLVETGQGHLSSGFAITRLHARYGKQDISEDLVFAAGTPIRGGAGGAGREQQGIELGGFNSFQGRYIIHNRFEGATDCKYAVRGRWTAPPPEAESRVGVAPGPNTTGELVQDGLAAMSLEALEDGDVPETGTPLVITTKADNSDNYCIGPTSRYESDPDITPETAAMIEAELNGTPRNPGEGGSGGGAVGGDASEGDEPGCQVASSDRSGAAIPMILLGIFGALGWSRRRRRR